LSDYRPLSKLGQYDPDLDTLHAEMPPWMVQSIRVWLTPRLSSATQQGSRRARGQVVREMERALRLRVPLDWGRASGQLVHVSVLSLLDQPGPFAMDCVGFFVSREESTAEIEVLNEILRSGGSAWEATRDESGYRLTRRDLGAAREAITQVEPLASRAHTFLVDSWAAVATREPNANEAYDKAVKAVEAAAHPVVQPNHPTATLGSMLGEMKAHRELWAFVLGDIDLVIDMADRLWTTHIRHGTDVRTDHEVPEADAALHLAIPLVRFRGRPRRAASGLSGPKCGPTAAGLPQTRSVRARIAPLGDDS
jgi:hypothetical protein